MHAWLTRAGTYCSIVQFRGIPEHKWNLGAMEGTEVLQFRWHVQSYQRLVGLQFNKVENPGSHVVECTAVATLLKSMRVPTQ